ncbi:MAG: gfo/Idh/MocA family oxidoreductase, partial [Planctomycetota bacterium]
EEFRKGYKEPTPWIPRSPGHAQEWINACKGGPAAMSNFDYAAMLTETILLGNLAMKVDGKIEWDGPNLKSTNSPEANKFVHYEYRKGYEL